MGDFEKDLLSCRGLIGEDFPSMSETIEAVRMFVHENSEHKGGEWHGKFAGRQDIVIKTMLNHALGKSPQKPHLTCGPRSESMLNILLAYDIYSKVVQIYSSDFDDRVRTHNLIEAYEQDRNRWVLTDPDFNVSYVRSDDGSPLTAHDLVFGDLEKAVPVSGDLSGWDQTRTRHLKDHYFQALLYVDDTLKRTNPVILVNIDRFDLGKRYGDGRSFPEWAAGFYGNVKILPFRTVT